MFDAFRLLKNRTVPRTFGGLAAICGLHWIGWIDNSNRTPPNFFINGEASFISFDKTPWV